MSEFVHTVTDQNFTTEVAEHQGLVLVDFWATWCGPCVALAPTLEAIAAKRPNLKVCKLDVEENPAMASQYKVRSIPYLAFIKNGIKVDELIGLQNEKTLLAKIDALLTPS